MSASRQIRPLPGSPDLPAGNRKAPASASAISPGRSIAARIGKYEVETEAGKGTVVRVFHAWDRATARRVTLRVLTDVANKPGSERFRREVAAMANVRNASLISIYELGEHVGMPFAALEYLGDDHLANAIADKRPFALLDKLRIMWQVAEGVQAAHRGGLSFVGLCPSGIALCADGSAKVRDFGMVRLTGDAADDAARYQDALRGEVQDVLGDIFSYGAIYYELLTGRHPLRPVSADSPADALRDLRGLVPDCPEPLEQLVGRALELDRDLRYQSFDEIRYDAEPILREFERLRASEFVEEARRSLESRELDNALQAVHDALELDPANLEAQRLRGELRSRLQSRAVRSRVEQLVREAGEETGRGQFARAAELLDAAARLDVADAELSAHLEQIRARVEQSRQTAELLVEVRQALDRNDLDAAESKVLEALEQDAENADSLALADVVADAIRRHEFQARIEEGIAKAKSMLLLQSFDAALDILRELESQCPADPDVGEWLAYVEEQKQIHEQRARFDEQLARARESMAGQRFEEAAAMLDRLQAEFPQEQTVQDLLAECGEASERAATIAEVWTRCASLCRDEQFDNALGVVDAALAAYPDDADLIALRTDVEQRQREFQAAAIVRQVLDEAQWLLDQDRVDLAVQFLREKCSAMPQEAALRSRLADVEQIQSEWEARRLVEDCLDRVATLEQAQQWAVALTVVEEALEICPSSSELQQAVERLRARSRDQERRKKLSRWVAEIREALADGDDAQAEETLQRALAALPDEPALVEMRQELDRDKQFRQEWRAAQVLVGRRQFEQAERMLVRLDGSQHPEVQTLLETVRQARAANEEQGFYNRGREKALHLIQQGQTEQAADLLRNLLSLFPGDAILERDLRGVTGQRREKQPEPRAAVEPVMVSQPAPVVPVPPAPAEPAVQASVQEAAGASWHRRPPVIAGAAFLAVVSAGVGVRRMLHGSTPPRPAVAKVSTAAPAPAPKAAAPEVTVSANSAPPAAAAAPDRREPAAAHPREARAVEEHVAKTEPPAPRRPFNAASLSKPSVTQPAALAPAPPPAPAPVFYTEIAALPAAAITPLQAPAPPVRTVPAPAPQAPAARPAGGNLQPVRPISVPPPVLPFLAKQQRISGTVTLGATVDKRGAVTNIKIISGNPLLTGAARDAVAKWFYKPATLNGQPIEAEIRIEVRFDGNPR